MCIHVHLFILVTCTCSSYFFFPLYHSLSPLSPSPLSPSPLSPSPLSPSPLSPSPFSPSPLSPSPLSPSPLSPSPLSPSPLSFHSTLERKSKRLIAQDGWSPPPFDSSCVRLVLYQDHEGRGKKQIFDTKAHQASMSNQDISESNVRKCTHYRYSIYY